MQYVKKKKKIETCALPPARCQTSIPGHMIWFRVHSLQDPAFQVSLYFLFGIWKEASEKKKKEKNAHVPEQLLSLRWREHLGYFFYSALIKANDARVEFCQKTPTYHSLPPSYIDSHISQDVIRKLPMPRGLLVVSKSSPRLQHTHTHTPFSETWHPSRIHTSVPSPRPFSGLTGPPRCNEKRRDQPAAPTWRDQIRSGTK